MYMDVYIRGKPTLFFVDTGYAGPPVINPWHQAREDSVIKKYGVEKWNSTDLKTRLKLCEALTDNYIDFEDSNTFILRHECSTYASTCTMRLAGIASDFEHVTDMVLCPEMMPHNNRSESAVARRTK